MSDDDLDILEIMAKSRIAGGFGKRSDRLTLALVDEVRQLRAPSPSPSSAPRPDHEQPARYLEYLGFKEAAAALRAAPASPQGERATCDRCVSYLRERDEALSACERAQGERERALEAGIRALLGSTVYGDLTPEGRSTHRRLFEDLRALAASSPYYAEKAG